MEFSINAGTLVVGACIFVLGVYVKPVVMVSRDLAVWWFIERYVTPNSVFREIEIYRVERKMQLARENVIDNRTAYMDDAGEFYYEYNLETIGFVTLHSTIYDQLMQDNDRRIAEQQQRTVRLVKKSNLFDSLIRHYSQERENPIQNELSRVGRKEQNMTAAQLRADTDIEMLKVMEHGCQPDGPNVFVRLNNISGVKIVFHSPEAEKIYSRSTMSFEVDTSQKVLEEN